MKIANPLESNFAGSGAGIFLMFAVATHAADPRTTAGSPFTPANTHAFTPTIPCGTAGTTLTTWSNGSQTQSLPAYDGVQEVYSSSNWVYVRSTGLASYNMGPWSERHTFPKPAGEPKAPLPVSTHERRAGNQNVSTAAARSAFSWTAWRCSTVGMPIPGTADGRR